MLPKWHLQTVNHALFWWTCTLFAHSPITIADDDVLLSHYLLKISPGTLQSKNSPFQLRFFFVSLFIILCADILEHEPQFFPVRQRDIVIFHCVGRCVGAETATQRRHALTQHTLEFGAQFVAVNAMSRLVVHSPSKPSSRASTLSESKNSTAISRARRAWRA